MRFKRLVTAVVLGSLSNLVPTALWSWYTTTNLDWFILSFVGGGFAYTILSFIYLLLVLLPVHLAMIKRGYLHGWLYGLIGVLVLVGLVRLALPMIDWQPRRSR